MSLNYARDIPQNIRAAAERAWLPRPHWYAGPRCRQPREPRRTVESIVAAVKARADGARP